MIGRLQLVIIYLDRCIAKSYIWRMSQTAGECLAEWRKKNGVTQSDLGGRLGISQEFVCQLERGSGDRKPGLKLAGAIERETHGEVPMSLWVADGNDVVSSESVTAEGSAAE